jgi:hypothetical protein
MLPSVASHVFVSFHMVILLQQVHPATHTTANFGALGHCHCHAAAAAVAAAAAILPTAGTRLLLQPQMEKKCHLLHQHFADIKNWHHSCCCLAAYQCLIQQPVKLML